MVTAIALLLALAEAPNPAQIKAAADYSASKNGFSYLVMHRGKVIAQENHSRATELASGTKSFSGVLALCAQEDGLLKLDEKVSDTLPEWRDDTRKTITIRQLLSLTSGIPGGQNALAGGKVPSYKEAILVKATRQPDARFQYGPNPFMIFGEVLRRKLEPKKESVAQYMERRLFKPIGLQHGFWRKDKDGNPHLPSGAHLTAREWAKFGEMVRLDGKGVLKPRQIKALFQATEANPSYGLTWWLPTANGLRPDGFRRWNTPSDLPKDIYTAGGAGGQRLYVIPSRELVVVRQAPVRLPDDFEDGVFLAKLLLG